MTTTPAAAPTFDLGPYAHDVRLTNTVIDGRDRYAIFNLDPISTQLPTRVYVFPHGQHYTALSGRAEYHGAAEGWIPTGLATIACGDTPADALALILGPVTRPGGGLCPFCHKIIALDRAGALVDHPVLSMAGIELPQRCEGSFSHAWQYADGAR